jgi:pantetheine-phosphate adenylyltransferase
MKKAVYGGSFDPPTNGHSWMIEQGAKLFDQLVIAIGINPAKEYAFSLQERIEMLKKITEPRDNTSIDTFQNQFLVNYAESVGAGYILRGIRSEGDYEYERVMRHVNSDLNYNILTVFLMPPREIAEVSSSFVKGLLGPKGWEKIVKKYVPEPVYQKFLEKSRSRTRFPGAHGNVEESDSLRAPF